MRDCARAGVDDIERSRHEESGKSRRLAVAQKSNIAYVTLWSQQMDAFKTNKQSKQSSLDAQKTVWHIHEHSHPRACAESLAADVNKNKTSTDVYTIAQIG